MEQDWLRLAECARERRRDLGLTQEEVSAAGGPSTATLRVIERGRQSRYKPANLRRLESALRWERGSVRAVLDGGEPVPVAGPTAPQAPAGPPQPPAGASPAANPGGQPLLARVVASAMEKVEAGLEAELAEELALTEAGVWDDIRRHPPGTPAVAIFTHPAEAALMAMEYTALPQRVRWIAEFRVVRARPHAAAESPRRAGLAPKQKKPGQVLTTASSGTGE
jgi:hypothetical protein